MAGPGVGAHAPAAWTILPNAGLPLIGSMAFALAVYLALHALVASGGSGFTNYHLGLILDAGIAVVLAVSLTVVNGFTGQFSMGHAGFMAVGGYVAASITYYGSMRLFGSAEADGGLLSTPGGEGLALLTRGDGLFVAACLVGGLVSAGIGYVVGLPSLRLRGDYLAIVTLGFGEIVRVILQGSPDQIQAWRAADAAGVPLQELAVMVGGPKGFTFLPKYTTLFWVFLFLAITLVVGYRLKTSSIGRAFLSIREDEVAAQAMGINVTRYKVQAFVLASFFAGIAGSLYAMNLQSINATDLGFLKSVDVIIMVVLGGMGSISGAALAAVILTFLPELLRAPPPVWPIGAVMLVVTLGLQLHRKRLRWPPLVTIAAVTAAVETGRLIAVSRGVNLAEFRLVIYAVALILMMILRPQGLFGLREVWDLIPRRRPAGAAPRTPGSTPASTPTP